MYSSSISQPDLGSVSPSRTLLVAHSDHYLLEHLVLGLEQSGFNVHNSNSGITCLAKMRWIKPAVLLLDPDLLWGGGDGVLASMVSCPSLVCIPVLLLVTFETNMEMANGLRTVVSDVLSLPTSREDIADRCMDLVEAHGSPTSRPKSQNLN
jgi:DNA-binding response OmpR family regulator